MSCNVPVSEAAGDETIGGRSGGGGGVAGRSSVGSFVIYMPGVSGGSGPVFAEIRSTVWLMLWW